MFTQNKGAQVVVDTGGRLNPNHSSSNTTTNCPAVPFASKLRDFNVTQSIRLFFGSHEAWNRAKDNLNKGYPALCLPIGERPENRDWCCVRGRSIVAIELDDTGPGFRVALVCLLAAWGAREVALILSDHTPRNAVFWGV